MLMKLRLPHTRGRFSAIAYGFKKGRCGTLQILCCNSFLKGCMLRAFYIFVKQLRRTGTVCGIFCSGAH
jgi:hypothetical protein